MIFATDQTMPMHLLAPEVEARGFESLWVTEKTHVPVSRDTPWPGGELPEWYKRTCDPVVAAKTIATLDWQSGGRLELGVGYGWNREECATHGVALETARDRLIEGLALMRSLWTTDEGSYAGEYYSVEPCWSWPKPVQRPGPPIHVGARATASVFADIAAWGDGWIPIEGFGDIVPQIPRLHAAFADAGRDPQSALVTVFSSQGDAAMLDQYREAGVDRVVVWLPPAETATVIEALDAYAGQLADL